MDLFKSVRIRSASNLVLRQRFFVGTMSVDPNIPVVENSLPGYSILTSYVRHSSFWVGSRRLITFPKTEAALLVAGCSLITISHVREQSTTTTTLLHYRKKQHLNL